jgi:hypothetical protein
MIVIHNVNENFFNSHHSWSTTDGFGGWQPYAHQYTGDVSVCGMQCDEDYIEADVLAPIPEPKRNNWWLFDESIVDVC